MNLLLLTAGLSILPAVVPGTDAVAVYEPEERLEYRMESETPDNAMKMILNDTEERYPEVPLIAQDDYPDYPFRDGTILEGGCSITSIAMIGSYLTDEFISPETLADRFNYPYWTIRVLFDDSADFMGIPRPHFTHSWDEAYKALGEGHVVSTMCGDGPYCENDHFIVLTGLSEDGKIMVNDPWSPNWTKSYKFMNAFENGFDPEIIKTSQHGLWIYDTKEEAQKFIAEKDK